MDGFGEASFVFVVTMCADAEENCPVFTGGTTYLHHRFADPVAVVRDKDKCVPFRQVRDQIRRWIGATFSSVGAKF
jgi:arsenate reductase